MVHCVAAFCFNSSNKSKGISFHCFPKDKKLRNAWEIAVGRKSLPKNSKLCSDHFEVTDYENSSRMKKSLGFVTTSVLKKGAIPSKFVHKKSKKPPRRRQSEDRAAKKARKEVISSTILTASSSSVTTTDTIGLVDVEANEQRAPSPNIIEIEDIFQVEAINLEDSMAISPPMVSVQNVCTQTEAVQSANGSCDFFCQWPPLEEDHRPTYFSKHYQKQTPLFERDIMSDTNCATGSSSLCLPPPPNVHCESASSSISSEENASEIEDVDTFSIEPNDSSFIPDDSEYDTCDQSDCETENTSCDTNRVLLVYENELKKLIKFCPSCGSPVEDVEEVLSPQGSNIVFKINCFSGCSKQWSSQPEYSGTRGMGNIALTSAVYLSAISFEKFDTFSNILNLKSIKKSRYYELREKYVFPTIEKHWNLEKENVLNNIKEKENVILCGDGRCDTPGHNAKYCTYSVMDVHTNKIIDFNVVAVSQVANSNRMEKLAFTNCIEKIKNAGVSIKIISTDRHPQISKELRTNHSEIEHQYDPWHIAKSITKKLTSASKKSDCFELGQWIQSTINHFWHCASDCDTNPNLLIEKWTSIIYHVTGQHEWIGNQLYHKCLHKELGEKENRKKKWLEPGGAGHNALSNVVLNKLLLRDIQKVNLFINTTGLEVYHAMYIKYLPKSIHFSKKSMIVGSMLAALDHNANVNRPQACVKEGELEGERRYKIAWSKVHKRFGAQPVLIKRSQAFLKNIMQDIISWPDNLVLTEDLKNSTSVMAPKERPCRKLIIEKRLQHSRFNSS